MAARYWVGGTATWDATAGTKWATTSGGAGGAAVPTSSDDVYFDGASGAVTVTTSGTQNCLTLTTTGFTGTLTINSGLNVNGNITLGASSTINGSNIITIPTSVTSTITNNGVTIGCSLTLNSASLVTLADDMTLTGNLTLSNGSGGYLNGNTLNLKGNLVTGANHSVTPTTLIKINGTGAQSWTGNFTVRNPLTIDKSSGTLTTASNIRYDTGTLTYSAGTVDTTTNNSILSVTTNTTFNLNDGFVINYATNPGGGPSNTHTITLLSNATFTDVTWVISNTNTLTINGFRVNIKGSLTCGTGSAGIITGTAEIVAGGTGTFATGITQIRNNFTINTVGTITFSPTVNFLYNTGTFTYTAGTVITTNNTFIIGASTTLNTNGISFYNITCSTTATITNNSLLTINNNLTYAAATVITMAGTAGWTTNNFYILTSNNISHILVAGKTYTVTTYFESIATTSSLKDSLISSIPGTKAIFTLNYGANQNVGYTNAVDIDSSLGQTIWTFNGVVTTTLNWNTFTSNSNSQRNYIF